MVEAGTRVDELRQFGRVGRKRFEEAVCGAVDARLALLLVRLWVGLRARLGVLFGPDQRPGGAVYLSRPSQPCTTSPWL